MHWKTPFQTSNSCIIAQLVNVLYNIVDRIFIGRLPEGDLAMAGGWSRLSNHHAYFSNKCVNWNGWCSTCCD